MNEIDFIPPEDFYNMVEVDTILDKEILANLYMLQRITSKEHNMSGMKRVIMSKLYSPLKKKIGGTDKESGAYAHLGV